MYGFHSYQVSEAPRLNIISHAFIPLALWQTAVYLKTGEKKLLVSLADTAAKVPGPPPKEGGTYYFWHSKFNRQGTRVVQVLRYYMLDGSRNPMTLTFNADGTDIRYVPLTDRVRTLLEGRQAEARSLWVFTSEDGSKPLSRSTASHQHTRLRRVLRLPDDFVVHSFRHTMLTRLGGAGVDVFTIKRIAGHSSVTVSEKYVHPSPEFIERAFERLEEVNRRARKMVFEVPKRQLPATIPATPNGPAKGDAVQPT